MHAESVDEDGNGQLNQEELYIAVLKVYIYLNAVRGLLLVL